MNKVTIIPCGGMKRAGRHPAKDLYIGSHFLLGRRAAEALGYPWFIMSGLYGLITPDQLIDWYEQRVPKNSPLYNQMLNRQASTLIGKGAKAILLLPAPYSRTLRAAAPWLLTVDVLDYPDLRMGKQRHILSMIETTGRVVMPREVYA